MPARTLRPCTPSARPPSLLDLRSAHWIYELSDGRRILIRPLEPKDREREFAFIEHLSPASRHFRFLCALTEPSEALMRELMTVDYKQRVAYIALNLQGGQLVEVGVARYAAAAGDTQCEAAVVVDDQWQRKGLGKQLMLHLIEAAKINGFRGMMSMDSADNTPMRRLATQLGFERRRDPLDATQVVYRLAIN